MFTNVLNVAFLCTAPCISSMNVDEFACLTSNNKPQKYKHEHNCFRIKGIQKENELHIFAHSIHLRNKNATWTELVVLINCEIIFLFYIRINSCNCFRPHIFCIVKCDASCLQETVYQQLAWTAPAIEYISSLSQFSQINLKRVKTALPKLMHPIVSHIAFLVTLLGASMFINHHHFEMI